MAHGRPGIGLNSHPGVSDGKNLGPAPDRLFLKAEKDTVVCLRDAWRLGTSGLPVFFFSKNSYKTWESSVLNGFINRRAPFKENDKAMFQVLFAIRSHPSRLYNMRGNRDLRLQRLGLRMTFLDSDQVW